MKNKKLFLTFLIGLAGVHCNIVAMETMQDAAQSEQNYFDLLPDELVLQIAFELIDLHNKRDEEYADCRSFLLTCKRFAQFGEDMHKHSEKKLACGCGKCTCVFLRESDLKKHENVHDENVRNISGNLRKMAVRGFFLHKKRSKFDYEQ